LLVFRIWGSTIKKAKKYKRVTMRYPLT
jgi:hypothetical protein